MSQQPYNVRLPRLVLVMLRQGEQTLGEQCVACLDAPEGELNAGDVALKAAKQRAGTTINIDADDAERVAQAAEVRGCTPTRLVSVLAMVAVARVARADIDVVRAARAYLEARDLLIKAGLEPALAELVANG